VHSVNTAGPLTLLRLPGAGLCQPEPAARRERRGGNNRSAVRGFGTEQAVPSKLSTMLG